MARQCRKVAGCTKQMCYRDKIAARLALAGGAGDKGSRGIHWCSAHRAYHTTSKGKAPQLLPKLSTLER